MEVPAWEVGYASATAGSGDNEVLKGYVVALERDRVREELCLVNLLCVSNEKYKKSLQYAYRSRCKKVKLKYSYFYRLFYLRNNIEGKRKLFKTLFYT
jgi:hypothetical protein